MSLVIDGQRIETPGIETVCWLDDPRRAPLVRDGRARRTAPTAVVLHTVTGQPRDPVVLPGLSGPSTRAERYAAYQATTTRDVSWHLTIDTDGTVLQQADLVRWSCWHAGPVNGWTLGVELVQAPAGALYEGQLTTLVTLLDLVCGRLAIPRRVPVAAPGVPLRGVARALSGTPGLPPWAGVLGHRNVTSGRGPGDPGDAVFRALLAAGYEGVMV